MNRSESIFGNGMTAATVKKAERAARGYEKKWGDDRKRNLQARVGDDPLPESEWGIRTITVAPSAGKGSEGMTARPETGEAAHLPPVVPLEFPKGAKPLVIGTIRMGYGHFRISMAMASAARSLGYDPYWLDLHAQGTTVAGQIVERLNGLYSLGSRLSQRSRLFDKLYWEPLNSEGFRKLSYHAVDQAVSALMAPVLETLPRDVPYIATHAWPAQAAVHAGFNRVVNAIPDNWPMALHLAEGAIHAVQTPFARLGYRTLSGMMGDDPCTPMPADAVRCVGHYVDHEFVANLAEDCAARDSRRQSGSPLRVLLSVGGAGAQREYALSLIRILSNELAAGTMELWVNAGDHEGFRDAVSREMDSLCLTRTEYRDGIAAAATTGHRVYYSADVFRAVWTTNRLMRSCDVLVTKPSELAFYPVPKLLARRVGGHEAWGAIRSADLGDGTPEIATPAEAARMLRLMAAEPDILTEMNARILDADRAGVWRGAYRAVELAAKGEFND